MDNQVAASLKSILSDVLRDLFDEWQADDYPERLGEIAANIAQSRAIFDEYLGELRQRDNRRLNDAAARDLADIYSGIYAAYLLLKSARSGQEREVYAKRFAIHANSAARASLEALKKGLFDHWLDVRD